MYVPNSLTCCSNLSEAALPFRNNFVYHTLYEVIRELWVANNQISDITPLSNLTNLYALELNGNQISDISAVSGLDKLGQLYLSRNMISDIEPLVENKGLREGDKVDLTENPLNDAARDVHIPA